MTPQELAMRLHGREYGSEITDAEAKEAKAAGLVVVYGYSDDTTLTINAEGVLPAWESIDHDDEDKAADYFRRKALPSRTIEALWCPDDGAMSWAYQTDIPHATFDVMEDGEVCCRGIVFALSDL